VTAAIDTFVAELRADPLYNDLAEGLEEQFRIIADTGEGRAIEITDTLAWIFRQQRSVTEKLVAIDKLFKAEATMPAGTTVSMRNLLGW
jgi:hypothetical protein